MSTITYVAKRQIEQTGFFLVADDISAAASDSSFNSVTSALAGLADNQWLNVAGFLSEENLGWFQLDGAAAAHKIVVDGALADEAIGELITLRGYKRGFDETYQIEFSCKKLEFSDKFRRYSSEALDFSEEVQLLGSASFWDIITGRQLEEAMPQWREFFHSVMANETFEFDPYGTIATPDAPVTCTIVSSDFTPSRIGVGGRYSIPFRVKVNES